MRLRGQPPPPFPDRTQASARLAVARSLFVAREGGQAGYAMAVLLVGMSIMAIMMTVAMPTWKQLSQREKEAELVFRGEQYARAMGLFQMKAGPGVLPPNIDLLVEQRFLRKKFKDPITNEDFVAILQTAGTTAGTVSAGQTQQSGRGGTAQPQTGSGQRAGQTPVTVTPGAATAGGIMGVTSKSKEQSIRLYKGRNHYNEWQFMPVARVVAPGAGGAPGAPGAPGVGGQRGGQRGGQGVQPGFPPGAPGTNPFGGGRRGAPPTDGRGPGPPGPNNPVPRGGQRR